MKLAAWFERMFFRPTWKGLAVLVAICLVNALRRNVNSRLLREDVVEWLIDVSDAVFTGFVLGTLVLLAVTGAVKRMRTRGGRYGAALTATALASLLGSAFVVGYDTDWTFVEETYPGFLATARRMILVTWSRYLFYSSLFGIVYVYLQERRAAQIEMQRLDVERAQFEQRTIEAQLQRLQAQIEPHFLFNTLAHVKRLYQYDKCAGDSMLGKLMRYLAEALPEMREPQSTVAREIRLAEAYLGIQQIRMGSRLRFELHVDENVAAAQLPPMMLLTLVENAIKHGLSPLPEGGSVTVRVRREGGELIVDVSDTGAGLTVASGAGTGISNVRARLAALHGGAARLVLAARTPRGVTAAIRVPYSDSTSP